MARPRTSLLGVLVVVLTVAVLTGGVVGWQFWSTRPQGSPVAVEIQDAEVSPSLAGATVLALGEATHGNAEFQRLRLQLLQKLPQFRALALEEDYGSVAQVDEWIQGGEGTAEDAVRRFGFRLNQTAEMVELLQWIRDHNTGLDEPQRIHLVGIDVQRVTANKEISLSWLETYAPRLATELRIALESWTDDTASDPAVQDKVAPVVDRLIASLTDGDGDGDGAVRARDAAETLRQNLELQQATNYARTRAELMAANLERTVVEQAGRGNEHTLLVAHNGHVDKEAAAFAHDDLGSLALRRWGGAYRVIGTEFHHSRLSTGQGADRWEVSIDNPTPLRGLYTGTAVGWIDLGQLTGENRALVERPVRMGSAGEGFQQWQAWLPFTNSVEMVPSRSYDALVLVDQATPTTPLG